MSFLVDTNIFLEILLNRPGRSKCEAFLQQHAGNLAMTDFSLHSIGVIAFRQRREKIFSDFLADTFPNVVLLHLDRVGYPAVARARQKFGLDFDDAYQFTVAQAHGLAFATQDKDFERVKQDVVVKFI